jgi:hypothetical protein
MKRFLKIVAIVLLIGMFATPYAQSAFSDFKILTAQDLPDIVVINPVSMEPSVVEVGEDVFLSVRIENFGSAPVEASFDVTFEIFNPLVSGRGLLGPSDAACLTSPNEDDASICTIDGLAPAGQIGSSIDLRVVIMTKRFNPEPFAQSIFVTADGLDSILELDESNNFGEGILIINESVPNLQVIDSGVTSELPITQGDLFEIEFTIANDTASDIVTPFTIELSLKIWGEREFSPLSLPGLNCPDCEVGILDSLTRQTITAQVLTNFLVPGEYQIRIEADSKGLIGNERDDADNVAILSFEIVGEEE